MSFAIAAAGSSGRTNVVSAGVAVVAQRGGGQRRGPSSSSATKQPSFLPTQNRFASSSASSSFPAPAASATPSSSSTSCINAAGSSRSSGWTHPKPHLAPGRLAATLQMHHASAQTQTQTQGFASSSRASSSSPSSTSTPPSSTSMSTSEPEPSSFELPTAPRLPPRRRPTFQAVGFGLGSSQQASRAGGGSGKGSTKGSSAAARRREPASSTATRTAGFPTASTLSSDKQAQDVEAVEVDADGYQAVNGQASEGDGEGEKVESEACYIPPPTTLHYHHSEPLPLAYSPHPLPSFEIAYETWGKLNADRSNAILLHTGLSASSHVASGGNDVAKETSERKGWWEDFVGPGKSIDTDKFFVICTNVIGGCFGSTGPSSQWPHGESGERWATRFPALSLFDMVRAQCSLLDALGIDTLYASVGASMGGMQSLALAYLEPDRVGRLASISATGRSGLGGVGMRFAQRSVLMSDPNWNRGFYYDGVPPHAGMKLARQIATITYRSGPEWETRFGRRMISETEDESGKRTVGTPSLSPDFLIETYLDHQGERFCLTYDANSMIYLSKAMDLFDMTDGALVALAEKFAAAYPNQSHLFPAPTEGLESTKPATQPSKKKHSAPFIPTSKSPHLHSLSRGLARLRRIPCLVLGVQSDILFPVEQQRELADALKLAGNEQVTYYELGGVWGHDTFLLDVQGVGGAIRGFLH